MDKLKREDIKNLFLDFVKNKLDIETHDVDVKEHYAIVTFKGNEDNSLDNGNGYMVSFGSILAEVASMYDNYGNATQEELIEWAAYVIEKSISSIYTQSIPSSVVTAF